MKANTAKTRPFWSSSVLKHCVNEQRTFRLIEIWLFLQFRTLPILQLLRLLWWANIIIRTMKRNEIIQKRQWEKKYFVLSEIHSISLLPGITSMQSILTIDSDEDFEQEFVLWRECKVFISQSEPKNTMKWNHLCLYQTIVHLWSMNQSLCLWICYFWSIMFSSRGQSILSHYLKKMLDMEIFCNKNCLCSTQLPRYDANRNLICKLMTAYTKNQSIGVNQYCSYPIDPILIQLSLFRWRLKFKKVKLVEIHQSIPRPHRNVFKEKMCKKRISRILR